MSRTIGVVFSYEELNSNVLFNAALRNLKKKVDVNVIAYVPAGFTYLFFSADEIIEIPQQLNKFTKYSEVSEYMPSNSNSIAFRVWNKLKYMFIENYKNLLVKIKLSDQSLIFALKIFPTHRQKYFLFKSGVWAWVVNDYKKRVNKNKRWVIFPVQDYISFSDSQLQMRVSTLGASFEYLFSELYFAISDGISEELKQKLHNDDQTIRYNTVYLRTRNYRNKQRIHNTTKNDALSLICRILEKGVSVVNIGSPALSLQQDLNVDHLKYYREISNVLTIDNEIKMLTGPILCRADAGLFVLIACLPVPIICLSPEWSESFGVRLMEARSRFGIKGDLDFLPSNSENEILMHTLKVLERNGTSTQ